MDRGENKVKRQKEKAEAKPREPALSSYSV